MEQQIADIKAHEQKLMEKTMQFIADLAAIKEHQTHTDTKIDTVQKSILDELHHTVNGRIESTLNLIEGQQKAINRMLEIQGKQGEQIESIKQTLEEFTKIQTMVDKHDERISQLEKKVAVFDEHGKRIELLEQDHQDSIDLRKERVKGRWSMIAGVISAIAAITCAIIAAIV